MSLSQYKSTKLTFFALPLLLIILVGLVIMKRESLMPLFLQAKSPHTIKLPPPVYHSNTSVEEALQRRRSIRQYKNEALHLQQIAQLLWAAQGITSSTGFRTVPSAGGLYPLEVYFVSGNVQELSAGVYHYLPVEHSLELLASGDKRNELAVAAVHGQDAVKEGAIDLILTANYKKTSSKYGNHSQRFVNLEAGHAAENIYLQAVSLGLGTVTIGVFDEAALKRILNLPSDQEPIYIMPVGKP